MNNVVEIQHAENLGIQVTKAAALHIHKCILKRGGGIGLRLHVTEAGCSGYRYEVSYVDLPGDNDKTFPIDEEGTLVITVDKQILPYVLGTTIDFQKEGLNSKFVFENPKSTGSCGCGESFTVD